MRSAALCTLTVVILLVTFTSAATAQTAVPIAATSQGPGSTAALSRVYVIYSAPANNEIKYSYTSNGSVWTHRATGTQFGLGQPDGIEFGGKLWIAYSGTTTCGSGFYFGHSDVWVVPVTSTDSIGTPSKVISGCSGGSKDGGPRLAVYNNKLWAFWSVRVLGIGFDEIHYASTSNGTSWSHGTFDPGTPRGSVGVAAFNGFLSLVYRNQDAKLFHSRFNGSSWSSVSGLPGPARSSAGPYAEVHESRLYALYKGASTNNVYFERLFTSGLWSSESRITAASSDRAPSAASFAGDLWVFYKVAGSTQINYIRLP